MMASSGFKRSLVYSHSIHYIDMAIEPEEGGELAHGREPPASQCAPKRAGKPSRLIEPLGCSARAVLAGAKRPFFLYREFCSGGVISEVGLLSLCGAPPRSISVSPRNRLMWVGENGSGGLFPRGGSS
jgi:hypothetical protein